MSKPVSAYLRELTPPEPVDGIEVRWTENVRYVAYLDLDQARTAFGLGGTPDDQVARKARLIARQGDGLVDPVNNMTLHEHAEPDLVDQTGYIAVQAVRVIADAKPTEYVPQTHYRKAGE